MPVSELSSPPLNRPIQIPALVTWPQAWGTIPPQLLFKSQLCRCQVSVTVSPTWLQHTAVHHVPKGLSSSLICFPSRSTIFTLKCLNISILPQGLKQGWLRYCLRVLPGFLKSWGQILTKDIAKRLITGDEGRTRSNRLRMTVLSRCDKTKNKMGIVWAHSCPTPGGLQEFRTGALFFFSFFFLSFNLNQKLG